MSPTLFSSQIFSFGDSVIFCVQARLGTVLLLVDVSTLATKSGSAMSVEASFNSLLSVCDAATFAENGPVDPNSDLNFCCLSRIFLDTQG